MDHQDWTPIYTKASKEINKTPEQRKKEKEREVNAVKFAKENKIEKQIENGNLKHKKMDVSFGKELQKKRLSKGMTQKNAVNTVIWLGLFKEGIDALVPWEQYGAYGGDGFSKNDVIYNTIGVGTAYLIDRLWEDKVNENKSAYIEIYPRHIRFSVYLN